MQNVKIEPFKVIGISVKTTNENGEANTTIAQLWEKFMKDGVLNLIPNKVDHTVYSLYTEYEGDHMQPYTAVLGCKVDHLEEIPEGLVGYSFEGGNYVKTSAKGDLMQGLIVNHWAKIWEMDLDRTYTTDFEVFGENAQNPSDAEIDFYVCVK